MSSSTKRPSSGNQSHVRVGDLGLHAPDRGRVICVRGWAISTVTYEILRSVLGPAQADEHCACLAKRQAA